MYIFLNFPVYRRQWCNYFFSTSTATFVNRCLIGLTNIKLTWFHIIWNELYKYGGDAVNFYTLHDGASLRVNDWNGRVKFREGANKSLI